MDKYKIFSAPLQGYTDCIWRNAHAATFGGIDTYCAPFMRIDRGEMRKRDIYDLTRDNNSTTSLQPQLLASDPLEATTLALKIKELGYSHIDINLGCPHPPVAKKHKGAGMLGHTDELAVMLDALKSIDGVTYSVKMRLGWDDNTQWKSVLDVLPVINPTHVAMHPRMGTQQYKGEIDMEQFAQFALSCPYPVFYNGDITQMDDLVRITEQFDNIAGVMIGRGLVANPHFMVPDKISLLHDFHNDLLEGYAQRLNGGEQQLVLKMKSLWEVFLPQANRKARKNIKKSHNMSQYTSAATEAIDSVVYGDCND